MNEERKELSKGELLECFAEIIYLARTRKAGELLVEKLEQAYEQIRQLIENQPKIGLNHIDKLLRHFLGEADDLGREFVIDWFAEAGVEIISGKDR